jgi:hypothetical protein
MVSPPESNTKNTMLSEAHLSTQWMLGRLIFKLFLNTFFL